MEENNNKKQRKLFIAGLFALLVMVIGATYAYFSVTTVNNFGTSTINATAGGIGSVTLNGNNAILSMDLTALDMVQGNSDVTYYAGTSGKTTTPTTVTLGTASVTPNTDTNYYHCTYTFNVTHTGTNDMYNLFNHQTNNTYDYTNRSTGQIILTINDTDYDFYNAWPTNNQVTGEFYIKGNQTKDITASLRFVNDKNINQSYLAGSDIGISISLVNNSFSCVAEEEPQVKYWGYEGNNVQGSNARRVDSYQSINGTTLYYKRYASDAPNGINLYNSNDELVYGPYWGASCSDTLLIEEIAEEENIEYDYCNDFVGGEDLYYEFVSSLAECDYCEYTPGEHSCTCEYIEDTSVIFIKETTINNTTVTELCANFKTNNNDNVVCMKYNDWANYLTYKEAFEGAGATCSVSNTGVTPTTLTCTKDLITCKMDRIYGSITCNIKYMYSANTLSEYNYSNPSTNSAEICFVRGSTKYCTPTTIGD